MAGRDGDNRDSDNSLHPPTSEPHMNSPASRRDSEPNCYKPAQRFALKLRMAQTRCPSLRISQGGGSFGA